jgi:hypothetical protein
MNFSVTPMFSAIPASQASFMNRHFALLAIGMLGVIAAHAQQTILLGCLIIKIIGPK